jgi:hypothetical protein
MLRALVLLLLLANAAYFAWSQGQFRSLGLGPAQQGEPQRLANQIAPQAIRILGPEEARKLEASLAARPAGGACLVAGPFSLPEAEAIESRLRPLLPPNAWLMEAVAEPVRWVVSMGPYASPDAVAKKLAELKAMGVRAEAMHLPGQPVSLSLGSFTSLEDANQKLQSLPRGVRTARVVEDRPPATARMLRIPLLDEALRRQFDELAAMLPADKGLKPC